VNQTKAALYIYNGYIPIRTAIGKFLTAALAIGSGHSLGPEDPSLQIGSHSRCGNSVPSLLLVELCSRPQAAPVSRRPVDTFDAHDGASHKACIGMGAIANVQADIVQLLACRTTITVVNGEILVASSRALCFL
jgi:Voltage gated chloride channel